VLLNDNFACLLRVEDEPVREDFAQILEAESGLGCLDVELGQVAVIADGDLQLGLGRLGSGCGFLMFLYSGRASMGSVRFCTRSLTPARA
jgi:hypothetical protein